MFKITIITIGKLKESYWKEAETEYLKRLSPYTHINLIEHKEISFSHKDKRETVIHKEAELILSTIPQSTYIIALDKDGVMPTSNTLASTIESTKQEYSHITFIIGGPLGLHESILKKAHTSYSLSSLTFTHQMARIILLEQLYRAHTITHNIPYHH